MESDAPECANDVGHEGSDRAFAKDVLKFQYTQSRTLSRNRGFADDANGRLPSATEAVAAGTVRSAAFDAR